MFEQNGHTTSLLEIRRFLEAEKAAPSPWAEPKESLESLYALLVARRDDPIFWSRLEDLVQRLEDRRVNLSRLGSSEALGYATVERLLADLRADLHKDVAAAPLSWKRALSCSLQATSLAAFLLLGTASVSCGGDDDSSANADSDTDTDTDGDTDPLCDEAIDNGVSGADGAVYCDLVDIINGSDLSTLQKGDLLACLPELDATYRASLLEAFGSMSDTEINDHLLEMLSTEGVCYVEDTEDSH